MRMMSALLGLVLMSGSALAADLLEPVLPVEPIAVVPEAFSWTGGYVGVDIGWATGAESDAGDDNDVICVDDGRRGRGCHYADFDNVDELNGLFAGVDAGFLYQTGMFVVGIEGDLKWANIDTGDDDEYYYGGHRRNNLDSDHGISLDWFGTARLSAGVAFDRALIYGTGGLAVGGLEINRGFGRGDDDNTEIGWTIGAGAKYALTDMVAVGAEYKYINFNIDDDNDDVVFRNRDGRRTHQDPDQDIDFHTVTLKLDLLF